MPDERDLREPEESGDFYDEAPSHEAARESSSLPPNTIPEPPHEDDETADLIIPEEYAGLVYLDEPQTPETLSHEATDPTLPPNDPNALPTMPLPAQPDDSAKKTLAGTGGLDPNPDFDPRDQPAAYTVPHIVPFEHTVVHVPIAGGKEQPAPSSGQTQPPPPPPPIRMPTPTSKRLPPVTRQPKPGTDRVPQPVPSQTAPSNASSQPPYYPPPQGAPGYPQRQQQAPLPRRRAQRRILGCRPGCVAIIAGIFVTFCGGLTLITLLLTATLGAQLEERYQAQVSRVGQEDNFQSTFYYDRNGNLLYEAFSEGRRTNVRYEDFPVDLINATVAIEDDSFWTNPGFEIPATVRAFLQYVGLASGDSGGSTITQQLVRNVLFDFEYRAERSVQRKVEEIILAALLTNRQSKADIITLYLNEIYFGNLSYGAQAAAQTFFGKDVHDLTLGEAALLAGLPQAPANLDPLNPDPAVQAAVDLRWRTVLDRMVDEGFISDQQRRDTITQGLTFDPQDVPLRAPHFTVYAQAELERLMGDLGYDPDQIARGGLRVYTTVDLGINDMAQQTARQQVEGLTANNVSNASVLVLKPLTGEILAMVGSIDYNADGIDGRVNVATSPRQPGSTMKPFTYAAALEQGMTAGDIIWDTPTNIAGYQPLNYDRTFHGPVRMRTALANSYNVPAVQTLRRVGVDYLLNLMARFGVESLGTDSSRYGLSLTLGGGEITLLELTRGYTVFANGGALVPSTSILCVVDNDDEILYQYENSCPRGNQTATTVNRGGYGLQVLDPRIAFLISDITGDNNARLPAFGSNNPLQLNNITASVKTGTTDDFKDNWTVGFTRNVAVGVWVGNTRGEPMVNSTGVTGAAPIWNQVVTRIYGDQRMLSQFAINGGLQPDAQQSPNGMSLHPMCALSQIREPAMDCGASQNEWFLDTPAGLPDGTGQLVYPSPPLPTPDAPPISGPWLHEVEPDIYRVLVQPIPTDIANGIIISVGPGQPTPPPPLYCQVPVELSGSAPGAREQLFIGPPAVPEDAVQAELFARNNGIAFLPTIACSAELLTVGGYGPSIVTAYISSPTPGQVITDNTPIVGTVQFTYDQAQFYKLEIIGGGFSDWTTIGSTHSESVINGQLEMLPGPGLVSGNYRLRLVVVGTDGNFAQAPYEVPFVVP
ncbi:MAG: transglycosylase domain-containing protein [Anaerolineae bacterium]|nr:transglycosylase domain-containing protein [Anaerolineae bacterium]